MRFWKQVPILPAGDDRAPAVIVEDARAAKPFRDGQKRFDDPVRRDRPVGGDGGRTDVDCLHLATTFSGAGNPGSGHPAFVARAQSHRNRGDGNGRTARGPGTCALLRGRCVQRSVRTLRDRKDGPMYTRIRLTRLWHSVRPGHDSPARPSD